MNNNDASSVFKYKKDLIELIINNNPLLFLKRVDNYFSCVIINAKIPYLEFLKPKYIHVIIEFSRKFPFQNKMQKDPMVKN